MLVVAHAFEVGDASIEFSSALGLQKKYLAFEIGHARGLHIFQVFQGLKVSEECFDIWWTLLDEGFKIGQGDGKLRVVFGCWKFAAKGLVADGALTLACALGRFNSRNKYGVIQGS